MRLDASRLPERKNSHERHSTSAPSKQLQTALDIVKSEGDSRSREISSPKSCGNMYSSENGKSASEKERPRSHFMASS